MKGIVTKLLDLKIKKEEIDKIVGEIAKVIEDYFKKI
jgi:hypothetical protein